MPGTYFSFNLQVTCTKIQNQNMPTKNLFKMPTTNKNKPVGKSDYFVCGITFGQILNTALKANVLWKFTQ